MTLLAENARALDEFEVRLGGWLPDDFREFMLSADDTMRHRYELGGEQRSIDRFYSIGASDPMFDLAVRHLALRGIVPSDLLAFARDDRGDLVCIGVSGSREGAVYLIRIRRDADSALSVRLLAPSFREFVVSCPLLQRHA